MCFSECGGGLQAFSGYYSPYSTYHCGHRITGHRFNLIFLYRYDLSQYLDRRREGCRMETAF